MTMYDYAVHSSELLWQGRIFAVRRDEIETPTGRVPRDVVEHFGATAVVAYRESDESIAMIRQYRHAVGRALWEIPAGLLDMGGEDELAGAMRELKEEVGLSATRWELLLDMITSPGFCDEAVRIYLATGLAEVPRPTAVAEEAELEPHWVPLSRAVEMVMTGMVMNSIAIAGILSAQQRLSGCAAPKVPSEHPFDLRPARLAARVS